VVLLFDVPVTITVWMRDSDQRHAVGSLPGEVELRVIPPDSPPPDEIRDARFVVPSQGPHPVLGLLARMPRLAVVQAASAGTEWLLPWVPENVMVCNARGVRDTAVAEWVLAAILAMEKQLPKLVQRQAEHVWKPELLEELAGKRALVVGYGSIGRSVADRLTALGVDVDGVASTVRARGFTRWSPCRSSSRRRMWSC